MSKQDEQLKESVKAIGKVVKALVEEGFVYDDAVRLTCAMLSSSQIYIPFADLSTAQASTLQ